MMDPMKKEVTHDVQRLGMYRTKVEPIKTSGKHSAVRRTGGGSGMMYPAKKKVKHDGPHEERGHA